MLRIALPNKGRLSEDTRALFNDAGLEVRAAGERALTASLGGEFEAIFVRAQDIPEFVADGAADDGDHLCEALIVGLCAYQKSREVHCIGQCH
jgi:ATP phosphoribosyltransferase